MVEIVEECKLAVSHGNDDDMMEVIRLSALVDSLVDIETLLFVLGLVDEMLVISVSVPLLFDSK
jgi:hypothetical protein